MWIKNAMMQEDLIRMASNTAILFEKLRNKDVLITGGTGLIGSLIIKLLLYKNKTEALGCRVHAVVRSIEKAQRVFAEPLAEGLSITFAEGDVCTFDDYAPHIDYIIHGASQTASKKFVDEPVETIKTALRGTENMLELARKNQVSGFTFLSTMEVYGTPETDEKIDEQHSTDLTTMEIRNCYPISKRLCENLCASYAKEYGFQANVIRLTQTFGPGVDYRDGRVFAEFMRCAMEKRDIVLHTYGETKRNYLYTADAVTAILAVLTAGASGEAYNAANEATYCSIYEMATMVANECVGGAIAVRCEIEEDLNAYGYAKTLHMNLDTRKLQGLGWQPTVSLVDMYRRMIASFQ